ncbi:MAG: hypothetical protein M0042_11780 [Nitrospiraceae bacterium]|nr:hypothetical protein [Nitrospiraceae bacterium]
MRRSVLLAVITLVIAGLIGGCVVARKPKTFVQTLEPTWASIEWKDNIDYDKAWNNVIDLLTKRFDLEIINKDSGYVRTNWLYTWTGDFTDNYRVRVTAKFNKELKKVEIKSEANYSSIHGDWVSGSDTRLLETLKQDIMGMIGRVTR